MEAANVYFVFLKFLKYIFKTISVKTCKVQKDAPRRGSYEAHPWFCPALRVLIDEIGNHQKEVVQHSTKKDLDVSCPIYLTY